MPDLGLCTAFALDRSESRRGRFVGFAANRDSPRDNVSALAVILEVPMRSLLCLVAFPFLVLAGCSPVQGGPVEGEGEGEGEEGEGEGEEGGEGEGEGEGDRGTEGEGEGEGDRGGEGEGEGEGDVDPQGLCTGETWPVDGTSCSVAVNNPGPPEEPMCRFIPLNDLGSGTYLGFQGGLYPGGTNEVPAAHAAVGVARGTAITPRDVNGGVAANGKIVMISLGMSNTTMEFCSEQGSACAPNSFMGRAASDPDVDHGSLVIVDGARGSQTAQRWLNATNYDRIRDGELAPRGLSEKQVQAAWIKVVNFADVQLGETNPDPDQLMTHLGVIVRTMKARYPNLQQVFLSSRIYAGYARCGLSPEPNAYESGFAVKWFVEAQIKQMQGDGVDARAGDLSYQNGTAPWIAWGPYLWADGSNPRSDGLVWLTSDYDDGADYTHPGENAIAKVSEMLLSHFKESPMTKCWFLEQGTCP